MSDIFAVSDAAVDRLAALDPLLATGMGLADHQDRWPDLSPDGVATERAALADIRAQAEACAAPDERSQLARRVLVEHCETMLALHDSGYARHDLNNIVSPHQNLRFTFGSMAADTVETPKIKTGT